MPEVMMVMSSLRVAPARKGRMVSGASVWPMKMLAATLVLSAPLVPIVRCMIQATTLMICCMRPMWYMMAKKAETKMMVGSTAKARVESGVAGCADAAEDEGGAVGGVAEESGDDSGDGAEDGLAVVPLDDEEGEDDLEAETPGDGAPLDGAAVGGESVGEAEKGDESEKSGESCQGVLRRL